MRKRWIGLAVVVVGVGVGIWGGRVLEEEARVVTGATAGVAEVPAASLARLERERIELRDRVMLLDEAHSKLDFSFNMNDDRANETPEDVKREIEQLKVKLATLERWAAGTMPGGG